MPCRLFVLTLLAFTACSDEDAASLTSIAAKVGASGGTLALPGGLALTIPAGALADEVEVEAELITDLAAVGLEDLPDYITGTTSVSVSLTPHGTTFAKPVTLALPLPAELAADPGNLVALRLASPDASAWTPVGPIRYADGKALIEIQGFSVYTLVQAGTCPCFNGSNLRSFYAVGENLATIEGWRRTLVQFAGTMAGLELDNLQVNYYAATGVDTRAQLSAFSQAEGTDVSRSCSAGADPGPGFVDGFPNNDPGIGFLVVQHDNLDAATFAVCKALVLASESGSPAHQIAVAATGLPAGESLVLTQGSDTFTLTSADELVFAPQVVGEGQSYTITIATQPAVVSCTLDASASGTMGSDNVLVTATCGAPPEVCNGSDDDNDSTTDEGFDVDQDGVTTCGPDGVAGTDDDDCDDADAARQPGATERCNGDDDDCDGTPLVGETSDGDGDGVPDACDAHPAAGCPIFDVARVREVEAMTGATCFVDALSAVLPAPLDVELERFTGAFVRYDSESWEAVGVGNLATDLFAIAGCKQDAATGHCTDEGRPPLPADSGVDATTYDACKDVATYACSP